MSMVEEMSLPMVAQSLDFTCGAACFESMYRFFGGKSLGELHFAKLLGTFELGYTAPERIVDLARSFHFRPRLRRGVEFKEIAEALSRGEVVFVTWWDVDAGHYSLVKKVSGGEVTLMDPWNAKFGQNTVLPIEDFTNYWSQRGRVIITVSE